MIGRTCMVVMQCPSMGPVVREWITLLSGSHRLYGKWITGLVDRTRRNGYWITRLVDRRNRNGWWIADNILPVVRYRVVDDHMGICIIPTTKVVTTRGGRIVQ